ncbi:MAG: PD40 domain-containing protein, partial [Candidatus Zixiibacteriota bacterium]
MLTAGPVHAQFSVLETDDMRLVYFTGLHSYLVPHVAGCFENSMSFHRQLWDYEPSEKVTVFVHDFGDYGNGGASSSPRNTISLGIAPLNYVYETAPANERVNSTMNHEVMHLVALDKATCRDRLFRFLFHGKVRTSSAHPESMLYSFLTSPRRSAPRWFHEGIAVFFETWMCGGYGRTQGAWDEMVFRTMVRDSLRIYDRLGLESEGTKVDFQVGVNSYLYGARFFAYLAYHYGPEKLIDWVSRAPGSSTYFSAQFKQVFAISLDEAWKNWVEWERSFQASNLELLRQYPRTPYRDLSTRALGSVSRAFLDSEGGGLITAVNYPGQVAHIVSIDTADGSMRNIREVKGAALYFVSSLAFDSSSGTLFYTTDNNDWRDLETVNLRTGKSRTLMKNERVGDLSFNPQDSSLWGVRHFNGISALVRIPHPYKEWNLVYSWPYGKDIYDIDISSDGKLLSAALAEVSGRQTLILMDVASLLEKDTTYTTLFDFKKFLPANFTFSPDSRYLYGSSYRTGVSNIHRYDLLLDSMEVLSNCETGLFRPLPVSDDSLIAFRYTGDGFVPVKMGITP